MFGLKDIDCLNHVGQFVFGGLAQFPFCNSNLELHDMIVLISISSHGSSMNF